MSRGRCGVAGCGPYELLRRVDTGGMGEVFLAEGPLPSAPRGKLAIKRVLPELAGDEAFVTMFLDEARVVRRFEHPNVCRVYEFGVAGGLPFLAMEWLEGVTLRHLLQKQPKGLEVDVVLSLGLEVTRALSYVHELRDEDGRPLSVVHRDVCPANIFITRAGEVKLLDFGLAKARTHVHRTRPGVVKGKFGYLAPERLEGRDETRSDVFGLGLCLYEALVGRPLFGGANPAAVIASVRMYREPPPICGLRSDVPPSLDALIRRMLARDPEDRFGSAAALELALEAEREGRRAPPVPRLLAPLVQDEAGYGSNPFSPPPLRGGAGAAAGPPAGVASPDGTAPHTLGEIDRVTRELRRDRKRRVRVLLALSILACVLAAGTCSPPGCLRDHSSFRPSRHPAASAPAPPTAAPHVLRSSRGACGA